MPDDRLSAASAIVAFQDVNLTQLRALFDQVDVDLTAAVEAETRVSEELDGLESEVGGLRTRLAALGISVPAVASPAPEVLLKDENHTHRPRYDIPLVPAEADLDTLAALARARLAELDIDLARDPLLQVLPDAETVRALDRYDGTHGDVTWSQSDWVVVITAGLLATLVDIVLVRIPTDTTFFPGQKEHSGSPITMWLNKHSEDIHREYLKRFERMAKVPFDASTSKRTGGLVEHMSPSNHRLKSFGHDPLTGFFFGILDLMQGMGTYASDGKIVRVPTDFDPVGLIEAMLTEVRHLLSDVATPAGLPAPLFTLLQFGDVKSPFTRVKAGVTVKATLPEISQYMYYHGYDLRHFMTMGIVPFVIEATIRGYWLLDGYRGNKGQHKLEKAKLASMLALGHTIATSGTLLKSGLIYQWNPLALNYAEMLATAPTIMVWLKETIARDRRINRALEEEWRTLLAQSSTLPNDS